MLAKMGYEFEMRPSLMFQNTKGEKVSTLGIAWQPRISTCSSYMFFCCLFL